MLPAADTRIRWAQSPLPFAVLWGKGTHTHGHDVVSWGLGQEGMAGMREHGGKFISTKVDLETPKKYMKHHQPH